MPLCTHTVRQLNDSTVRPHSTTIQRSDDPTVSRSHDLTTRLLFHFQLHDLFHQLLADAIWLADLDPHSVDLVDGEDSFGGAGHAHRVCTQYFRQRNVPLLDCIGDPHDIFPGYPV